MAIESLRYDIQPERLPPHNTEAEEGILGSVILDASTITRVRALVEPRDFYRERNAVVFQAMLDLDDRVEPVDYLTLKDELERTRRLDAVGGAGYLAGLVGAVPTPIHAETYAETVADAAFMRRLVSAGGKIATLGFENRETPTTAMARAEQILADVASSVASAAGSLVPQAQVVQRVLERLAAVSDPNKRAMVEAGILPSTFRDLDKLLQGGFVRGELVVVAGRPGTGKSSLMMALISGASRAFKLKSVIFTLEMTELALGSRQLATASKVPLARFRDGKLSESQRSALGREAGVLAEYRIKWDSSGTQTAASIRAKARRESLEQGGLDYVVVDHLQLMDGPEGMRENRTAEVTAISRQLKALAKELNCVVIALSQLNRNVEQRADKLPQLSDLRESGSIEQDADVVLLLSREELYRPDTDRKGIADLQVAKARDGQTGRIALAWNGETTGFLGMEFADGRV